MNSIIVTYCRWICSIITSSRTFQILSGNEQGLPSPIGITQFYVDRLIEVIEQSGRRGLRKIGITARHSIVWKVFNKLPNSYWTGSKIKVWLATPKAAALFVFTIIFISKIFFHSYVQDTGGEMAKLYLFTAKNGFVPGFNYKSSLRRVFLQAPAIFILQHILTSVLSLPAVVAVKLLRVVLSFFSSLLVYGIARQSGCSYRVSLMTALVFSFSVYQAAYIEEDQLKNLAGVLFSLALAYGSISTLSDIRTLSGLSKLSAKSLFPLGTVFLVLLFSHRLYIFLVPSLLCVYFGSITLQRWLGVSHFTGTLAASVLLVTVLFKRVGLYVITEIYRVPHSIGLYRTSAEIYDFGIIQQIVSPGILFYNLWSFVALMGGFVWLRRRSNGYIGLLLFGWFALLFVLSKDYLLGFPFVPGRFTHLIPPVLSLFSVYWFERFSMAVEKKAGIPSAVPFYGSTLSLLAANLVILNDPLRLMTRLPAALDLVTVFGDNVRYLLVFVLLGPVLLILMYPSLQAAFTNAPGGLAGPLSVPRIAAAITGFVILAVWSSSNGAVSLVTQSVAVAFLSCWGLFISATGIPKKIGDTGYRMTWGLGLLILNYLVPLFGTYAGLTTFDSSFVIGFYLSCVVPVVVVSIQAWTRLRPDVCFDERG